MDTIEETLTKSSQELYNEVSDLIRPKIPDDLDDLFKIEFSEDQKAYIRLGIQMLLENSYMKVLSREESEGIKFEGIRKPNRRSRQSYTPYQIFYLEKYFNINKYPTSAQKRSLAMELDTTEIRVKTWFQNRRQKFKKFVIEDRYYSKDYRNILIKNIEEDNSTENISSRTIMPCSLSNCYYSCENFIENDTSSFNCSEYVENCINSN